jgi:dTDP-L-rhamnose 4-epimerase
MRALISDIARIGELGFAPTVDLSTGIDRYLAWIREQGSVRDYFAAAERRLKARQVVKQSRPRAHA